MAKFIEITTSFDGKKHLVNLYQVVQVDELEEGKCEIILIGSDGDNNIYSFLTVESYEKIRGMIYKAQGGRVLPVKEAAV